MLRRIERWLHQHIFKVGWLITQDYQTTTILYYTVFLPGVIVHEVILWLAAGIFNVHAERSISWPEPQEVGRLELNFVKLHSRAGRYRKLVTSLFPLFAGIVILWFITNNIFNLPAVAQTMSSGELPDIAAGIGQFTSTPDFWLWIYLTFTIGNTMFPTATKNLRGWRFIAGVGAAVTIALVILGLGSEIFEAIAPTIADLINILQLTCMLLIGTDVMMVLLLGTVEYAIEHLTGRSATFRRGRMITMTREEAIEEREKAKEREIRRRERRQRERAVEAGPRTIYAFTFPVPGAPGDIPVTELDLPEPGTEEEQEEAIFTAEDAEQMAERIRLPEQPTLIPEAADVSSSAPPPAELPETPDVPAAKMPDENYATPSVAASSESRPPLRLVPDEDDKTDKDQIAYAEATSIPDEGVKDIPSDRPPLNLSASTAPVSNDEKADETDDTTGEQPAVVGMRFGTSDKKSATVEEDKSSNQDADQTQQEDTDEKKPADRFQVSPFKPAADDDDTSDTPDDTTGAISRRFGQSTSKGSTSTDQPAASTQREARFGTSRFRQTDDDDAASKEADNQSGSISRFGQTTAATGKDDDESYFAARWSRSNTFVRPNDDRFNVTPYTPSEPDDQTSEDDTEESGNKRFTSTRFSRFSSPSQSSTKTDDDADDEITSAAASDEATTSTSPSFRTPGKSPFRRLNRYDDDLTDETDDEDDNDESLLRRGRGSQDSITNLFSGLNSAFTPDDDAADDDTSTKDDIPALDLSKLGRPRRSLTPPVRFGSSRPVPKPTSDDDDNDDDNTDTQNSESEIDTDTADTIYEDIDDYYDDEDDYIDYDDL